VEKAALIHCTLQHILIGCFIFSRIWGVKFGGDFGWILFMMWIAQAPKGEQLMGLFIELRIRMNTLTMVLIYCYTLKELSEC